jgi:DNA polymerase-3 subunit gamma/tau
MSYQVLARKWRPQDFASLVGQESIVTALRNALREGRIAQAYLFSGIRGVGKTTAARVLAKALNCENGPAADPCNHCAACLEITRGSDLDVVEVDAATYSKVEQIRELTESLKYGPSRDRYKVVVLDEVHRLSRQAFDALLKIVEEPPAHLVFIFATTEVEAVPATILSRCQEFHFRRVPSEVLAVHLRQICDSEGIAASDSALRLIARAGEGSVRDSVALLDQMATFGSGAIADDEAARMLGGLDTAFFYELLAAILSGDSLAVVAAARRMEDEGWDPRHLYGQFLAFGRDALHLALGGGPDAVDLPVEEAQRLSALARQSGYENLLRLLNQLLAAESSVRRSEAGALAAEIAWLKAAELPKLSRIEELLGGGTPLRSPAPGSSAAKPAAAVEAPRPSRTVEPERQPVRAAVAPRLADPPAAEASAAASPPAEAAPAALPSPSPSIPSEIAAAEAAPSVPDSPENEPRPAPPPPVQPPPRVAELPRPRQEAPRQRGAEPLQDFLDEISKRKQPLAAHLAAAEGLSFADGELAIVTAPGDTWLSSRLETSSNRAVLEEALAVIWGPGNRWRLVTGQGTAGREASQAAAPPVSLADPVREHPGVQTILDIFGGRIEKVEEHGP